MQKKMKNLFKNVSRKKMAIILIVSAIMTFLFLSVPVAVYPDSLTYFNYLRVFNGLDPISSWELIRGPSLPAVLFIFVSIFGNAMLGMLVGMYIFFAGTLTMCYLVFEKAICYLKTDKYMKAIATIIFIGLVVFNPITFGYCHALLTEFIAIFFAVAMSILAWLWIKVDFVASKLKFVSFCIAFIAVFVFMWFLKQPYLTVAFFPLLTACVLSIVNNHGWRNVAQRSITFVLCIICLVISINGWREFLITNGSDIAVASNVNESFLSSGIIKGISNVKFGNVKDATIEKVKSDKLLDPQDKKVAIDVYDSQLSGGMDQVRLLDIKNRAGEVIDKMVVVQKDGLFTTDVALKTWLRLFIKHPLVVIDSYAANFMAIVDIYPYLADPVTGALTPLKSISLHGHENHSIGLLYAYYPANMDTWTRDVMQYPGQLTYIKNNPGSLAKRIILQIGKLYMGAYIVLFFILPAVFVYSIIRYALLMKKNNNQDRKRVYELVIILLGLATFNILFNDVLGAIIDRYNFIAFSGVAISYILLICDLDKVKQIVSGYGRKYSKRFPNK